MREKKKNIYIYVFDSLNLHLFLFLIYKLFHHHTENDLITNRNIHGTIVTQLYQNTLISI